VRFYALENRIVVEEGKFDTSTPITRKIIVERFLDYGCDGDRERYLYRNLQIESFLNGLNLDGLRRGAPDINKPLVLLDDRYVLAGLPAAMPDNYESSRQTLSAHELYIILRNSVCYTTPCPGQVY
jgi:hypothetical protein